MMSCEDVSGGNSITLFPLFHIVNNIHVIESKNVDGETALHYAALRGSMEAVEALLEFGADSASVFDE